MVDRKKQTNRRQTRLEKPRVEQKQVPASAPQVQGSPAGDRSSQTVDAAGAREASAPGRSDRSAGGNVGGKFDIPSSVIELWLAEEIGPNWGCGAQPGTIAVKGANQLDGGGQPSQQNILDPEKGQQPPAKKDYAQRAEQIAANLKRAVRIVSRSREGFEELVPRLGNQVKDRLADKLNRMRVLTDEMIYFLDVDKT
jgi:hypothetical protein